MNDTDNNRIRESLEQIEPAAGAKERMLANIRRKAAEQSSENAAVQAVDTVASSAESTDAALTAENIAGAPTPAVITSGESSDTSRRSTRKASPNRRITAILRWAVPVAACLIIVILGATQFFPRRNKQSTAGNGTPTVTATVTPDSGTTTFGPLTTYASAEELAAATGIRMDAPAGATDVTYESAGSDFAQVCFTYGGLEYTLRASKADDDFSGLYGEESAPRQLVDADGAVLTRVQDVETDFFKLVWKTTGIKNILVGSGDTPDEKIVEVYRKLSAK